MRSIRQSDYPLIRVTVLWLGLGLVKGLELLKSEKWEVRLMDTKIKKWLEKSEFREMDRETGSWTEIMCPYIHVS